MSRVVLRCPNCGTTRSAPGECEACHEEQVRYYCTNHSPGRWLEGLACPQCGARFGEVARPPAAPAPTPPPAPRRRPAVEPPPATAPRPRYRPTARPTPGSARGGGRERFPPRGDDGIEAPDERDARMPGWDEMLRAAARARLEHAEAMRHAEAARGAAGPPAGRGLGGCLFRFVLMLVFFVLAVMSGLFLFVGQFFSPF